MSKGFYTLLIAQFLSALADNALLFAAIAVLQQMNAPQWHEPLLLQFFVISYIVLAPFVGSFADALPKGRVMFLANGIKFFGSLAMILGMPPLYAYGIVGIGAAAYSPAKYGILTELLPPEKIYANKDISLFARIGFRYKKNINNVEQLSTSSGDSSH
jgi:MFS family permease